VADVLVVTAFELGYPMVRFVLVEAYDLSIHRKQRHSRAGDRHERGR
jgi:hypothetical protein